MFFLPRKTVIFTNLVKQATSINSSAKVFKKLSEDFGKLSDYCDELEDLEHRCDEYVHRITDEIEKSFVLSMDKEDIKQLTELLDDVVDKLEETANRLKIYEVKKSNETLISFAQLIVRSTHQIQLGVELIEQRKFSSDDYVHVYKELHDLENKGDEIHRTVLKELMGTTDASGSNVLWIIKWKEIYQTLEDVLDKCENIAIVFERLRIKYR